MAPSLLVLAAGMGSRYGGLKQIDPVGPSGETVLDYAVFDAVRAGFGRAVFVIRRELEETFRKSVLAKYSGRVAVELVFQEAGDLPPGAGADAGRQKPWGTGHAVWCARAALDGPFGVINADDFYGADSFARLAGFLRNAKGSRYAIVGFRLARTLSENGTVSRGVCRVECGRLVSITEERAIGRADVGPGLRFSGEELVSMNLWGFTPDVFGGLEEGMRSFLADRAGDSKAEFYLPAAISDLVSRGSATVEVLASREEWFGITYREDRGRVLEAIRALVARGVYPARLFP